MVEENKEPSPSRKAIGFGCPSDAGGIDVGEVHRYLRAGSPRLALAKALCVPFQPFTVDIRAIFPTTTPTDIPNVGVSNQQKFEQDCEVEKMTYLLVNRGPSANSNILQTLSDYWFNYQSGIEATLLSGGGPPQAIFNSRFEPLATMMVPPGSSEKWPGGVRKDEGWILGMGQQLLMSFKSTVQLPDAPYEVIVTFRGTQPKFGYFSSFNISNLEALNALATLGFTVPQTYRDFTCRTIQNR